MFGFIIGTLRGLRGGADRGRLGRQGGSFNFDGTELRRKSCVSRRSACAARSSRASEELASLRRASSCGARFAAARTLQLIFKRMSLFAGIFAN